MCNDFQPAVSAPWKESFDESHQSCWHWTFGALVIAIAPFAVAPARAQPNVLVIMTDDQSHDTVTNGFMPQAKARILDQGVTFTRGYMSTPLCQPSRAQFMTGRYARTTGVIINPSEIPQSEVRIAEAMKAAGYYTIHIGKYLNTFSGDCRPEYDYWAAHPRGASRYVDPDLNINCKWLRPATGYITYLFRDQAIAALRQVPHGQPFYLELTPNAPHSPATPAPEDESLYQDLLPNRPPNFNPTSWPMGGKPAWLTQAPLLSAEQIDVDVDQFRLNQLRSLASLDRSIGAILDELEAEGKLNETLILFWTDNGYLWGEQRLLHKNHVYEEASHFTFAIRYPPLINVPFIDHHLVQVIDLGPTIYEITGVTPIGLPFDGRSLVPLLQGTTNWRNALLLEGWPNDPNHPELTDHYQALRCSECVEAPPESSGQFVYVETVPDPNGVGICDSPELYDIFNDPYEMNNLVNDIRYSSVVSALHERLASGDF